MEDPDEKFALFTSPTNLMYFAHNDLLVRSKKAADEGAAGSLQLGEYEAT